MRNRIFIGTRAAGSLKRSAVLAATMVMATVALQAQTVSFAGAQTNVPASGLSSPSDVAVDGAGNVFIAVPIINAVVKVSPGGAQTNVPASGLHLPSGVAVDAAGNVFIADTSNDRVVELPSGGGAQTTVASGLRGPRGVAVDAAGNVFIADTGNNRVLEVFPGGAHTDVPASGLSSPFGVAVDGMGDVFITDFSNNRVVKVSPGGTQTTLPASGLNGPRGVAVDSTGNVFIADVGNDRVVELPSGGGAQTTVGSGLFRPSGVALDGAGNVFIADDHNRVVEVQAAAAVNFATVNVCPSGQNSPAPCSQTATLIYNVTASGTLASVNVLTQGAPNLDFTSASDSTCTGDVTAGSTCTVNVTFAPRAPGPRMGAVQLTDASGTVLATTFVHGIGQGPAIAFGPGAQSLVGSELSFPTAVAVDGAGDVFIADDGYHRVVEVSPGGVQTTVASGLNNPVSVAVDGAGTVFVADYRNNSVVKVSPGGAQTTVGSGLNLPVGVAVDAAGDVFIADTLNDRVVEVPAGGGAQITVGSGLSRPYGVAVDAAGDVFIADTLNDRVVEVPAGGGAQITVGSGLSRPEGVAVDAAGNVFIAEFGSNLVTEVFPGGAQTTVASGLNYPVSVAVDAAGNLFIVDTGNQRVVEINRSQPPALAFAATAVGSTSSDSPQSLTVESIGNAPLVFSGLTAGTNFAQAAGSGTPEDCTSTSSLAPGASCNLSITFTPQSAGSLQGTAVLTDNALNGNPATQSIPLSGTGTQLNQTIAFNPIPNQVLGTTVTLSASASSGLPVNLTSLTPAICTVSGTTATLVSAGTCTIQAMQAGNSLYQAAPPVSQSFSVTFAFTGFFQPVNNPPTVNLVRAGSAIPVTFSLGGNQGSNILAVAYPVSNQVSCTSGAPTSDIGQTVTAGSSSLGYNATTNQYTYVWKTNKSWSGTCQQFILTLTDGTTHTATFQFN